MIRQPISSDGFEEGKVRLENKIRILEFHRSGRSIASLTREFRVSRSTILRVLAERDELELNARCAEMLARGVEPYVVAECRRSGLKRVEELELSTDGDGKEAKYQ